MQSSTAPELSEIGVPSDAFAVTPYGHAVLGPSSEGEAFVTSASNTGEAAYRAMSTTFIECAVELQEQNPLPSRRMAQVARRFCCAV